MSSWCPHVPPGVRVKQTEAVWRVAQRTSWVDGATSGLCSEAGLGGRQRWDRAASSSRDGFPRSLSVAESRGPHFIDSETRFPTTSASLKLRVPLATDGTFVRVGYGN